MNLNTTPRPAASTVEVVTTVIATEIANMTAAVLLDLRSRAVHAAHKIVAITLPVVLLAILVADPPANPLAAAAMLQAVVVIPLLGVDLRPDHNHIHKAHNAPVQIAPYANFTY